MGAIPSSMDSINSLLFAIFAVFTPHHLVQRNHRTTNCSEILLPYWD